MVKYKKPRVMFSFKESGTSIMGSCFFTNYSEIKFIDKLKRNIE